MTDEAIVERAGLPAGDAIHGVRIEVGAFGPWQTNAYLIWDGRSAEALIVDPGMGAAQPLIERAEADGLRLHLIANSHGHIDHIFDNAPLIEASKAPLAIHPDDAYRLDGRNNYGFELQRVTASRDLTEGEQVRIGDLVFDVLHTPGHTEGSVCLYEERLHCSSPATSSSRAATAGPISPAATTSRWRHRSPAWRARFPGPSASCRGTARRRPSSASCRGCGGSRTRAGCSLPDPGYD